MVMTLGLRRTAAVVILVLMSAGAVGCATRINSVLADPSKYRNREVKVSGTVLDSYAIAGRGAYQLEDGTGRLWVITDRGVPRKGARVTARGVIREAFNLGALGDRLRLPGGGLAMFETDR
jgi:hypothetical protein